MKGRPSNLKHAERHLMTKKIKSQIPLPVESLIHTVRGHKVILDSDLAEIYGVELRRLNEQVKRNADRFPDDFVFRLTPDEWEKVGRLRSQNATLKRGQHRKHPPYVFTEYGALMAANILKSKTAVSMSIYVVRAFIRMREELTSRRELEERLDQIEKILLVHDTQLKELFEKIRPLLLPLPEKPRKKIYPVKTISPPSTRLHYENEATTSELPHVVHVI